MSKFLHKALVVFVSFQFIVLTFLPSFAATSGYTGAVTGWWDKLLYQWTQNHSPYWWGDTVQSIAGFASGEVCGSSPDAVHHASSVADDKMYESSKGNFVLATCIYCHDRFRVYASDLQKSYESQVSDMPVTGYGSSGNLVWYPSFNDVSGYSYNFIGSTVNIYSLPYQVTGSPSVLATADVEHNAVKFDYQPGSYYSRYHSGWVCISFYAPFDGTYSVLPTQRFSLRAVDSVGLVVEKSGSFSTGSFTHYSKGTEITAPNSRSNAYTLTVTDPWTSVSYWYFPAFEVVPDSSLDIYEGGIYSEKARPGSLLGIYGDIDGNAFSNNSFIIVDETNNTVYNPVTGDTYNMTGWTFNYDNRTYTITLESGDTITITYGDEYITYVEGDTIYNIYYIINNYGSGEDPDPGTDPDVPSTSPGTDDDKSIWEKLGDLIGSGLGGILKLIEAVVSKLLDGLIALVEMLTDKLAAVVEAVLSIFEEVPAMFGGFLDFLAAMFPFLPPEIMLLLTFGIAAVVFIGIIKALRR